MNWCPLVVSTGKLKLRPSSENIHLLYIDNEIEKVYHNSTKIEEIHAFLINCRLSSSCASGRFLDEGSAISVANELDDNDELRVVLLSGPSLASVDSTESEESVDTLLNMLVDKFRCIFFFF